MSVFSFSPDEALRFSSAPAKLESAALLEKEQGRPQETVHLSAESTKRQIIDEVRMEVLQWIRNTR